MSEVVSGQCSVASASLHSPGSGIQRPGCSAKIAFDIAQGSFTGWSVGVSPSQRRARTPAGQSPRRLRYEGSLILATCGLQTLVAGLCTGRS
jgi:hypothetical protein